LSVTPKSGNGNGTVVITALANTANTERKATVTVLANGSASQEVKVTQTIATGMKEVETVKCSVYPNPFSDGLYIDTGNRKSTISIYTVDGWLIFRTDSSGNRFIPMHWTTSGIYMVELTIGKETIRKKLVKW
jgi:hypothetical protein